MLDNTQSRTAILEGNRIDESANRLVFGFANQSAGKILFGELAKKRITALAFDYIRDEHGSYPIVQAWQKLSV